MIEEEKKYYELVRQIFKNTFTGIKQVITMRVEIPKKDFMILHQNDWMLKPEIKKR